MKSFLLFASILFICVGIHTGVRMWGYTSYYSERKSPILPKKINHIYAPSFHKDMLKSELSSVERICKTNCLVSIPTYFTKDKKLVLFNSAENSQQHLAKDTIKSLENLELELKSSLITLESFLDSYPNAKGILLFDSSTPGIVKSILPILSKNKNYKRFILCSKFGNIVRSIRDEKPHWNTCASQDEKTKAHILSSIFLESVAKLPTEYFYFDKADMNLYSERLYGEIARRTFYGIAPFGTKLDVRAFLHPNEASYLLSTK